MCGCARHQQVSATAGGGVSAAIGAAAPQKCADKLVRIRVMGCYREAECVCVGELGAMASRMLSSIRSVEHPLANYVKLPYKTASTRHSVVGGHNDREEYLNVDHLGRQGNGT